MLTYVLIAAAVVLGLLVVGCLVGRTSAKIRQEAPDWRWWFGRLCAVADIAAVGGLFLATFKLNGTAPQSTDSAIASVVYVAMTALLVAVCGPVSDETEDRTWIFVMLAAFVGALVLAVQYQPELSNIGNF